MKIEWYGDEWMKKTAQEMKTNLLTIGADLQAKSVNEAPIDTGKLRESCTVDDNDLDNLHIVVGYAAEVDEYSMKQHETIGYHHPKGGKAKFLEDPLNQNAERYLEYLIAPIGGDGT